MFCTDPEKLKAYTAGNRLWQGIPSIEVTPNGRIFSTFYSGGTKEEIGNFVLLLKSDNGTDFSEPIAVAVCENHRCFDPCLWIDPSGRLWFWWTCAPENAVYGVVCDNPDQESLHWSDVIHIGNDVMMNKPIVLKNGEWLLPIAVWAKGVFVGSPAYSADPDKKAFVYVSDDNGQSFRRLDGVDAPCRSFDEHMVLELSDDTVAMYIRTTYGIAVAYSYNNGRTWTPAKDSGLGGPCSRFHISRLKSGRILFVNHVNFRGRNNLYALLSEDNGKTWPYKLLIDERANVSYPDAKEASDGIYITYDRERGAFSHSLKETYGYAREILYAKITEQDILAGKLLHPDSRLRVTISKLGKYNDEQSNPYDERTRYSEAEAAAYLESKTAAELPDALWELFSVSCMNLHKVDGAALDALLEQLQAPDLTPENKHALLAGLVHFLRGIEIQKTEDSALVGRVKDYLAEHANENPSLETIAGALSVSKFYLCHEFKRVTGMTLTDWKNYLKIKKAKELLSQSGKKIADIAEECGFDTISYFSETFKNLEKITPEAYRAQRQKARA